MVDRELKITINITEALTKLDEVDKKGKKMAVDAKKKAEQVRRIYDYLELYYRTISRSIFTLNRLLGKTAGLERLSSSLSIVGMEVSIAEIFRRIARYAADPDPFKKALIPFLTLQAALTQMDIARMLQQQTDAEVLQREAESLQLYNLSLGD